MRCPAGRCSPATVTAAPRPSDIVLRRTTPDGEHRSWTSSTTNPTADARRHPPARAVLADTVREQEGAAAFEMVEGVRKRSIAFRRDDDWRLAGSRAHARRPEPEQTMIVVRAFSYFSHLANLAEESNGRLRASPDRGGATRRRQPCRALDRIEAAGVDQATLATFFRDGQVVPC